MNWTVQPADRLRGKIVVPGDKSISHRAVLLASIAAGESSLEGLSDGADVASTIRAMRALGTRIDGGAESLASGRPVIVAGRGLGGLTQPSAPIDCGNSGTTMRLLAGVVAGQPFATRLTGDRSLRRRPMRRIAEPLCAMGAAVATGPGDTAPLAIRGVFPLRAIDHRPEIASAQVKSCVLLAGLYADGPTTIEESTETRDHTERMLAAMGATVAVAAIDDGHTVRVEPAPRLAPLDGRVPGDVSAAAYWIAAASVRPGSEISLPHVGLNPTRAAIIDVLRGWGAAVEVVAAGEWYGEPYGEIRVRAGAALSGGSVGAEAVPRLIDELPLLAALAPLTTDGVEIRGAGELRVKESDRIATIAQALRRLGVRVDEFPDGLAVAGGQAIDGGTVDAAGDHRIALAIGAVAPAAAAAVTISGAEAVDVSYPGFPSALKRLAAG